MADALERRGKYGSTTRNTLSRPEKKAPQKPIWFAVFGQRFTSNGGTRKSSSIDTPSGFTAFGFIAMTTSKGTRVQRAQNEILNRWNGNHRGACMISTGITGTARQGITPNSARKILVKTLTWTAPPAARIASRAFAMYGASGLSPAAFSDM